MKVVIPGGTGQVGTIATPNWNVATIGQVFGIAIDNSNNIYLAATDIYSYDSGSISSFGSGGRAGIYKTNVNTPGTTNTLVTTLTSNAWNYALTNKIPNSGVGSGNSIGNIAFDKTHNFVVTSCILSVPSLFKATAHCPCASLFRIPMNTVISFSNRSIKYLYLLKAP